MMGFKIGILISVTHCACAQAREEMKKSFLFCQTALAVEASVTERKQNKQKMPQRTAVECQSLIKLI